MLPITRKRDSQGKTSLTNFCRLVSVSWVPIVVLNSAVEVRSVKEASEFFRVTCTVTPSGVATSI